MLTDYPSAFAATALLMAVLTWSRPGWAIVPILVELPLFAHHPITPLAHWLIALVAVVQSVYVLRVRPSFTDAWRATSTQPLLLLGALFVAAAFLSLSSLPLSRIWREHGVASGIPSLTEWPQHILEWMRLTEAQPEFSVTSALLTLQGYLLALIVWQETKASSATALRFSAAIILGMVLFVMLGLLEAFGIVDLEALRGITQVAVRPGTLQSTAGNPGWFSEYLVYALPYPLVLLAGASAWGWRVARLTGLTALAAFAILVCFQRGGWISGAVVILYMVAAGTRLLLPVSGSQAPARHHVWRTLAAVGVVFLLVAGGFSVWLTKARSGGSAFGAEAYVTRLKSIVNGDRLPYLFVGWKLAVLHPVLGGGHESFAYLYQTHVEQPGGLYHRSPLRVPDPASAHSVYFQTLTGTGAVGLALLVGMFGVAAFSAIRALRTRDADRARHVALLAGCGSLLGIACYGLVQEVFYIHALRLLYFAAVGMVAGATGELRWPRRAGRVAWLALAAAFAVHLGYENAWPGPERLLPSDEPVGLHDEERGPGETRFRWSTEWSAWPVPAGATTYSLQVRLLAPFAQQLEVDGCRGARTHIALRDHAWHTVDGRLEGCAAGGHLQLRVSPSWRPPGDGRLLGVMTADVRFH